jgi:hypothetical protein
LFADNGGACCYCGDTERGLLAEVKHFAANVASLIAYVIERAKGTFGVA